LPLVAGTGGGEGTAAAAGRVEQPSSASRHKVLMQVILCKERRPRYSEPGDSISDLSVARNPAAVAPSTTRWSAESVNVATFITAGAP